MVPPTALKVTLEAHAWPAVVVHPAESSLQPMTEARFEQSVKTAILESKFTEPQVRAMYVPVDGATKRNHEALYITSALICERSHSPVRMMVLPAVVVNAVSPSEAGIGDPHVCADAEPTLPSAMATEAATARANARAARGARRAKRREGAASEGMAVGDGMPWQE